MNARLIYMADGGQREVPIRKPVVTIGRRRDCEVCVPSGLVSRQHCQIIQKEGTLVVKDLGSANGTCVNEAPVSEQVLYPGDVLQVGPVSFEIQYEGAPPRPAAAEPAEAVAAEAEPLAGIADALEAVEAAPVDAEDVDVIALEAEPAEAEPVEAEAVAAEPIEAEPIEAEAVEAEAAPGGPGLDVPDGLDAPIPLAGSNIFDEDEEVPTGSLFAPEAQPTLVEGKPDATPAPAPSGPAADESSPAPPEADEAIEVEAVAVDAVPLADDPAPPKPAVDAEGEDVTAGQDQELADFLATMQTDGSAAPGVEISLDEDESPAEDRPEDCRAHPCLH